MAEGRPADVCPSCPWQPWKRYRWEGGGMRGDWRGRVLGREGGSRPACIPQMYEVEKLRPVNVNPSSSPRDEAAQKLHVTCIYNPNMHCRIWSVSVMKLPRSWRARLGGWSAASGTGSWRGRPWRCEPSMGKGGGGNWQLARQAMEVWDVMRGRGTGHRSGGHPDRVCLP